jgi:hypothetical protein
VLIQDGSPFTVVDAILQYYETIDYDATRRIFSRGIKDPVSMAINAAKLLQRFIALSYNPQTVFGMF